MKEYQYDLKEYQFDKKENQFAIQKYHTDMKKYQYDIKEYQFDMKKYHFDIENKEERYSRVPRLSDTRYSASSKARLKCATYRRYTYLSVMGVRVGVANFWINR